MDDALVSAGTLVNGPLPGARGLEVWLVVPGRGEVRVPSVREWRRNWRVYRRWANAEISYAEAKKMLRELAERVDRGVERAPLKG